MRSGSRGNGSPYAQIPGVVSSPLQVLARFHYRRAAVQQFDSRHRETERRPLLRLRYAIRRDGTGLLLRRTTEGNIEKLRRSVSTPP